MNKTIQNHQNDKLKQWMLYFTPLHLLLRAISNTVPFGEAYKNRENMHSTAMIFKEIHLKHIMKEEEGISK